MLREIVTGASAGLPVDTPGAVSKDALKQIPGAYCLGQTLFADSEIGMVDRTSIFWFSFNLYLVLIENAGLGASPLRISASCIPRSCLGYVTLFKPTLDMCSPPTHSKTDCPMNVHQHEIHILSTQGSINEHRTLYFIKCWCNS